MNNQNAKYRWPDLSPLIRQYIVVDDIGRLGIARTDGGETLAAHPCEMEGEIEAGDAILLTSTIWRLQPDGRYTGTWCDYDGPTFPASVPDKMIRHLTIVSDLGYLIPEKWASQALTGSDTSGHWDYGATIGKVGGEPPVNGVTPHEMTVGQAVEYAAEIGEKITRRGVRAAAKNGHIAGARKSGRDWLIPFEGLNKYFDNRPSVGRPANKQTAAGNPTRDQPDRLPGTERPHTRRRES